MHIVSVYWAMLYFQYASASATAGGSLSATAAGSILKIMATALWHLSWHGERGMEHAMLLILIILYFSCCIDAICITLNYYKCYNFARAHGYFAHEALFLCWAGKWAPAFFTTCISHMLVACMQGHKELPSVNLEKELFAKLQERAHIEGKSLAHLASEAVRQYVI